MREQCPLCDQWVNILTEPDYPELANESWDVHRACCCVGKAGFGICNCVVFSNDIGTIYLCMTCGDRAYARWDDHEINKDPLSVGPVFRAQHRHGFVNGFTPVHQVAWVGVE